jgi:PhnB protein
MVEHRAVPMLSYEDVAAAVEWLHEAFAFRETGQRFSDDEGRVTHAEIELDGALIYLGWPGPDYESPRHHAEACERAARWLSKPYVVDGVHVTVADVDAHHDHAVRHGAKIVRPPKDEPFGRMYVAADLEGHRWMFESHT